MKKLLGFQLADLTGKNIQGDDNDPSNLPSFDIMSPERATEVMAQLGCREDSRAKYLLMPIFEGCIEEPTIDGQPLKFEREPDEEGDDLIAVAPNGMRIRGTLERAFAVAPTHSFSRKQDGSLEYEFYGETDNFYDNQETVERDGRPVFEDDEGNQWTEDQIRLIRNPEAK